MVPSGWSLEYFYLGSEDVQRDLHRYEQDTVGEKVWHFRDEADELAAVRVDEGPLYVLAGHRPSGSCIPMFSVPHLDVTAAALREHGWQARGEPIDLPQGPCYLCQDPEGNEFAIFENVHPQAMEAAYADPLNGRAVR